MKQLLSKLSTTCQMDLYLYTVVISTCTNNHLYLVGGWKHHQRSWSFHTNTNLQWLWTRLFVRLHVCQFCAYLFCMHATIIQTVYLYYLLLCLIMCNAVIECEEVPSEGSFQQSWCEYVQETAVATRLVFRVWGHHLANNRWPVWSQTQS